MAVTINASTSAGLISTADTSGILQLQTAWTAEVVAAYQAAQAAAEAARNTGAFA